MFLKSMDPKLISHHRNLLFDHRNPRYSHLCRHGSPGVKGLKWFAKVVYIYLSDELPGISAFAIFNYLLVTNLLVTFFFL